MIIGRNPAVKNVYYHEENKGLGALWTAAKGCGRMIFHSIVVIVNLQSYRDICHWLLHQSQALVMPLEITFMGPRVQIDMLH